MFIWNTTTGVMEPFYTKITLGDDIATDRVLYFCTQVPPKTHWTQTPMRDKQIIHEAKRQRETHFL